MTRAETVFVGTLVSAMLVALSARAQSPAPARAKSGRRR